MTDRMTCPKSLHCGCRFRCRDSMPPPPPTDIIERLRAESGLLAKLECTMNPSPQAQVVLDATAEIERLRAALREIESLPRSRYVISGPMLPASIARRALSGNMVFK